MGEFISVELKTKKNLIMIKCTEAEFQVQSYLRQLKRTTFI